MKKFIVYYDDKPLTTVHAERVWANPEGYLRFYNVSTRGDVAGFSPGAWSYYAEVKES